MDLAAARRRALELMREHGLADWRFRFDRARRRLGSCSYADRTLSLSEPLTLLNDAAVIEDTLLHEIAHALTPGAGHGPRWRAEARRLGATPRACVRADRVVVPAARYALVCDGCGVRIARYRRPRARLVCRGCYERHRRGGGPPPAPLRLVTQDAGGSG